MYYQHAIDPVAFSLGPLSVHWYGIMYLVSFVVGFKYGGFRIRHYAFSPLDTKQWSDFLTWAVLAVIIGGRVGYVLFYQAGKFFDNPLYLFFIWEGGMSFHGGLIGSIITMLLYERRIGLKPFALADFVTPIVPIGLFFGRLGNFIGAELWGKVTDVPWAVIFPAHDMQPRHPSQLYEMFLEGLVLFIIMALFCTRQRPRLAASGLFLMCYALFRILVEFVREPDAHIGYLAFGIITTGHVLSIPMAIAGAVFLVVGYTRKEGKDVLPSPAKKQKKKRR